MTTTQQPRAWDRGADTEQQWQAAQRHALAWWGRAVAWLLVVVGMIRGMRLIHDAALGATSWLGSLPASLLVTWGLTFGGAAALWWGARGVTPSRDLAPAPPRHGAQQQALMATQAIGAALCFGVGAGGLWAWGASAGAGLGLSGWVGLIGAAGAAARAWPLTHTHTARAHAWWALSAAWLALWIPASAGPIGGGAVAVAVTGVLWRLWRARATGWSLGLGVVTLTAEMLRGREVTFWFMAGSLCAYGALTLLNPPSLTPSAEDEALTYQSVFIHFGTLLLSVIAAALCCWAMNIPLLWRGLFWPWGL
jgi:hypothetical protein